MPAELHIWHEISAALAEQSGGRRRSARACWICANDVNWYQELKNWNEFGAEFDETEAEFVEEDEATDSAKKTGLKKKEPHIGASLSPQTSSLSSTSSSIACPAVPEPRNGLKSPLTATEWEERNAADDADDDCILIREEPGGDHNDFNGTNPPHVVGDEDDNEDDDEDEWTTRKRRRHVTKSRLFIDWNRFDH